MHVPSQPFAFALLFNRYHCVRQGFFAIYMPVEPLHVADVGHRVAVYVAELCDYLSHGAPENMLKQQLSVCRLDIVVLVYVAKKIGFCCFCNRGLYPNAVVRLVTSDRLSPRYATVSKLVQFEKAFVPTVVTLAGIITLSSAVHL